MPGEIVAGPAYARNVLSLPGMSHCAILTEAIVPCFAGADGLPDGASRLLATGDRRALAQRPSACPMELHDRDHTMCTGIVKLHWASQWPLFASPAVPVGNGRDTPLGEPVASAAALPPRGTGTIALGAPSPPTPLD